ncbi:protein ZBED8-like [Octopus sinensis]|uniref:Protein ZBED8-like n=1 Tax=Octopus sinensis TaxID=2607531 RepID=A0A6P7TGB1_9MOLL|nr:protein ZBED8-like [Octopus sinensis]
MDLSANIDGNVQSKLQSSGFVLQVDELTGISNKAQLLTFIRFIGGNQIINQFFCCEEMPLTTRGQHILDTLSAYLKKWNLSWNSCVGICTNGAPSMIGSIKGFVSLIQQQNPNIIRTHCFLHREVLVSKTIPVEQVLNPSY